MRVNRRFLYLGVFLAAMGGVLVAVDVRAVDTTIIADALRLWPFAFVAIGLGLVLRRTRLSVPGGILAAAVPGLCWAVASRWLRAGPADCRGLWCRPRDSLDPDDPPARRQTNIVAYATTIR